jgi:catalase (peroxidase I)
MDALAEIKHLYYNATRTTIQKDLARAVALLKAMPTEEDRERAAVYMDGLSQMRSEWHAGGGQGERDGRGGSGQRTRR